MVANPILDVIAYWRIYLFIFLGAVFLLAVRKAVIGRAAPWPTSFDHSLNRLTAFAGRLLTRLTRSSRTVALFPRALSMLRPRLAQFALLAVPIIIAGYGVDWLSEEAKQLATQWIFGSQQPADYYPWTAYAASALLIIFGALPLTLYFAMCTILFVAPAKMMMAVVITFRRPVILLGLVLFVTTLKDSIVPFIYAYVLPPWPAMDRTVEWLWAAYSLPSFIVYILCGVFMFAIPAYLSNSRQGWAVSRAVFWRSGVPMLILLPVVAVVFNKIIRILMYPFGWALQEVRPPMGDPNREWFDSVLHYLNAILGGAFDCLLFAILAVLIAAAFLRERDVLSADGSAVPPQK